MPDPLSTVASGIAASLAADAVDWGIRQSMSTRAGHRIQEKVGFKEIHPKAKEVFERAIIRAGENIPQLDGSVLDQFIEDDKNRQILAVWIWNPDQAVITRDDLNWAAAGSQADQANIKHLLDDLPKALRDIRKEVFDDNAWFVVQEVVKAIKHEEKKTREKIEEEEKKTRSNLRSEVQNLKNLILSQGAASEDTSQFEEVIREEVEKIQDLREEGRLRDALISAKQSLDSAEERGFGEEVTRALHSEIANCHLSRVDHREDAIPHLHRVAELADDQSKSLLNYAVIDLLQGDFEDGLEKIDRVLDEQPEEKDAVLLKAQLLADSGDTSEAADLFEEVADLEDTDDLYNLGTLEVRSGQFASARVRAEEALEINQDHPSAHFLYGLSVVAQRHEELDRGEIELSEDVGKLLKSARHHLAMAVEEYSEDQQKDRAAMAHFNLGVLLSMKGDETEAYNHFSEANRLSPENPKTLHNLAHTALNTGDGSEGLDFFRDLENTNHDFSDEEMLHLKSSLLMEAGKPEDAIDLIEEAGEKEEVGDITVRLLRSRALHRNLQTEDANEVLEQLIYDHPEDPRPYLECGVLQRKDGNLEQAIDTFRTALEKSGPELESQAQRLLAGALFIQGSQERRKKLEKSVDGGNEWKQDLEEAEGLYKRISSPTLNTLELRRRALCLFRLGRYAECIQLCEKAQEDAQIPTLTELEGLIYQLHESFSEAADRFEWLIQNHQKTSHFLLKYSNCLFRLGSIKKAKNAVDQAARQISQDSIEEQIIVSKTYAEYGEMESAVKHAHCAIQAGEENPQAHQYYISLFATRGHDIQAQDAASEEQEERFRKAIAEYQEKFPDDPFIEPIEVPTDDPEALSGRIQELLPSFEDERRRDRAIREQELTVGAAAKLLGKSIPAVWGFLSSHPEHVVKADEGREGLIDKEADIAEASGGVITDLVPLLTLQELGLLEEFADAFARILVPQAALDSLMGAISDERPHEGDPRTSIRQTENGIAIVDEPAETGDKRLNRLKALQEHLTGDSFTIVGQTVHRDETANALPDTEEFEDQTYEDLLGRVASESILEGKARGMTVYAEDRLIRSIVRAEERSTFGTRALLEVLFNTDRISTETYHEARVSLLEMGYVFPVTSTSTIVYSIEREEFVPTSFSKAPIEALEFPGTNPKSILRIAVQVLGWIWSTHDPYVGVKPALSAHWTDKLLSASSEGSGRRKLAFALEEIIYEYLLPQLSQPLAFQLKEAFERWVHLKGHWPALGKALTELPFPTSSPLSLQLPDPEEVTIDSIEDISSV